MSIKKDWLEESENECNSCHSSNELGVKKKIDAEPLREPTRLFFSSPCLLSEIEDEEDVLKQ